MSKSGQAYRARELGQRVLRVFRGFDLLIAAAIVAGIDDLARWRDCTAEEGHFCQDKLAFSVAPLDPKTFIAKPPFHGDPGLLQGASVALAIDNALYVGTATGDRLLKIPSVELSTPTKDVN